MKIKGKIRAELLSNFVLTQTAASKREDLLNNAFRKRHQAGQFLREDKV